MTNTLSRRESTVPIGGNLNMRIQEMSITSYETDGEDFAPIDVNMRRFVFVIPLVVDDTVMTAQYDESNEAVLLNDGGSEAASSSSAELILICVGV